MMSDKKPERGEVLRMTIDVPLVAEVQDNGDGTWSGRIPVLSTSAITRHGLVRLLDALALKENK